MPIRTITSGTTFTATDTISTSAFQLPGFYQPTSTVGYYIEGTDQSDHLWGSAKDDWMHGYYGNDVLYGQDGNDTIFGENGNDQLLGGAGNDTLDGGNEDDLLDGGAGADTLIGGAGNDTASYINSSSVTVELGYRGFGGEAEGDTYSGIENVIGSNWNDTIIGDAGNNTLNGGAGDDTIMGGTGNDVLIGGAGRDVLIGDTVGNASGSDLFVIDKATHTPGEFLTASLDTIKDLGAGDKILLKGYSASDFGTDGKLAVGVFDLSDHGLRFAENMDASDHLFANALGGLFYGDAVMRDGEWFIENAFEVVEAFDASIPALSVHFSNASFLFE